MAEPALSYSRDPESSAAVWVGTGNLGIRRHPIAWIGIALLRREKRKYRRQRIHRDLLASRKNQVLTFDSEEFTRYMTADRLSAVQDDLHFQVVESEFVVAFQTDSRSHVGHNIPAKCRTFRELNTGLRWISTVRKKFQSRRPINATSWGSKAAHSKPRRFRAFRLAVSTNLWLRLYRHLLGTVPICGPIRYQGMSRLHGGNTSYQGSLTGTSSKNSRNGKPPGTPDRELTHVHQPSGRR